MTRDVCISRLPAMFQPTLIHELEGQQGGCAISRLRSHPAHMAPSQVPTPSADLVGNGRLGAGDAQIRSK